MDNLKARLRAFVERATEGRDASHGVEHMARVAALAEALIDEKQDDEALRRTVVIVAWLHDVADHKYETAKLRASVLAFLEAELFNANAAMDAIDAVSYSTEKRLGARHYESKLFNAAWVRVRNLVSDADKLDALGSRGGERCLEYTRSRNRDADDDVIYKAVWAHAQEKLLRLHGEYMRTQAGTLRSRAGHEELLDWIETNGIASKKETAPWRL